jgi:hypothetical protein
LSILGLALFMLPAASGGWQTAVLLSDKNIVSSLVSLYNRLGVA